MLEIKCAKVIFLGVIILANLNQSIDAKLKLNTGNVFVTPGSGFMNYVRHDANESIRACFLTYPSDKANHTIEIFIDKEQDFSNAPFFGNRLSNMERNLCGIKISESREEDAPNMTLFVNYTIDGGKEVQSYNATFYVTHYLHVKLKDEVKEVDLGTKVTVSCGIQNVQKSCTMFDPQGKIVTRGKKKCDYEVNYLTMEHIGNWTCIPSLTLSMKPLKEILELRTVANPNVTTWYKEENGFGKIGCQYTYFKKENMNSCTFINPKNKRYQIVMTSATGRYTTIGTNFNEKICQIEFQLPLLDEEIGTWKCIINKGYLPTGGFIDVRSPNTRKTRSLSYAKRSQQFVQLGQKFTVNCTVAYSTKNCYIISPDGEYFFGGGMEYFNLGECTSGEIIAMKKHLGVWTFHFSRDDEVLDDTFQVEVVEEYNLHAESPEVIADLGSSVTIMCNAPTPIQSCQFVGPDELTYNVSPDKKSLGIHYAGLGLEYGACGLEIDSVQEEHEGVWTCIINNKGDVTKSLNDTVLISLDTFTGMSASTASAIGVPVGIMVVAGLLLGIALIRKFTKRTPANSTRTSDGSNTDIPMFDIQSHNNYETTNNTSAL